ncbi:hypothetical protein CRYUN_Cryun19dG0164000 [Craigia yunnanensis]
MSSTNVGSEQAGSTEPALSIQKIIERISKLHDRLNEAEAEAAAEAEADSHQQTTVGTNTASNNQTGNEQDGSNSGDVSQGNSDDTNKQDADVSQEDSNKQDGDVSQVNQEGVAQEIKNNESNKKGHDDMQEKTDESNKRKEVLHELGKLSKELQYMISSFKKLENFETNLREPLETLEANVVDILKDLHLVKVGVPKQVPLNLRVLRNNITRVKIQIPLQHQNANSNSEANRALQTTVATREAEDLPHLYNEDVFKSSYYFKEIKEKYKKLGDGQKLKLLCFAIFPENAEIKKRLLRFWWVGENLIPAKDTDEEKKLVDQTLEEFVEKGFIEPIQKTNKLQPRSYKMNPIVHSCLINFAKEAQFFDYDSEGKPTMNFLSCKKACMVKSEGAPVSSFSRHLKEQGTERLPADLERLQMLFNFPKQQTLEEEKKTLQEAIQRFPKLQTLFNISKQFPALPIEWFSKMTNIGVLYLGRWETSAGLPRHIEVEDIDFLKGLKNMKKLRLLSLQGISGIPKLPSTLCKLENLRILDLRACHSLERLPDRIGSLKKLTYLDLSECYLLDDVPKQLNQLGELQVLKGFVIGDSKNSCTLKHLSKLKNLRKLSVNVNTMEFNIDYAGEDLSKFEKLQKLKIAWGSGGLTGNNSTQDGGEGKRQKKDSVKSKTKNQEENKKSQNIGSSESMASNVSEQDNGKQGTVLKRLRSVINKLEESGETAGINNLVKLDLQCFPRSTPPDWLVPQKMIGLKNLCIRGGKLGHLIQKDEKWKVETLRLKFLMDFKMNWKEIRERFPELEYLEKVRCPRITFCPCDANGVWQNSSN